MSDNENSEALYAAVNKLTDRYTMMRLMDGDKEWRDETECSFDMFQHERVQEAIAEVVLAALKDDLMVGIINEQGKKQHALDKREAASDAAFIRTVLANG